MVILICGTAKATLSLTSASAFSRKSSKLDFRYRNSLSTFSWCTPIFAKSNFVPGRPGPWRPGQGCIISCNSFICWLGLSWFEELFLFLCLLDLEVFFVSKLWSSNQFHIEHFFSHPQSFVIPSKEIYSQMVLVPLTYPFRFMESLARPRIPLTFP